VRRPIFREGNRLNRDLGDGQELPCIRLTKGGPLRFDVRDIEEFITQHKE
jgi:hypothetical protein